MRRLELLLLNRLLVNHEALLLCCSVVIHDSSLNLNLRVIDDIVVNIVVINDICDWFLVFRVFDTSRNVSLLAVDAVICVHLRRFT